MTCSLEADIFSSSFKKIPSISRPKPRPIHWLCRRRQDQDTKKLYYIILYIFLYYPRLRFNVLSIDYVRVTNCFYDYDYDYYDCYFDFWKARHWRLNRKFLFFFRHRDTMQTRIRILSSVKSVYELVTGSRVKKVSVKVSVSISVSILFASTVNNTASELGPRCSFVSCFIAWLFWIFDVSVGTANWLERERERLVSEISCLPHK